MFKNKNTEYFIKKKDSWFIALDNPQNKTIGRWLNKFKNRLLRNSPKLL